MKKLINRCNSCVQSMAGLIPVSLVLLLARLAVFFVFWRSVQTKITGLTLFDQHFAFWNVTATTKLLFNFEYNLPVIPSDMAAYMGTFAEFFFALMLLFGVATRLGALGLLGVTAVIQIFVFPGAWPTHILWAALLIMLMRDGGGKLSLDYLIKTRFG